MTEAVELQRATPVRFELRRGMGRLRYLAVIPAAGALLWLAGGLAWWVSVIFAIVWLIAAELWFRLLNYVIIHAKSVDISTLPWGFVLPWFVFGFRRVARIPFARIAWMNAAADGHLVVAYWKEDFDPRDPIALDCMEVYAQRGRDVTAEIVRRGGRQVSNGNPVAFRSSIFQRKRILSDTHLQIGERIIPLSAVDSVVAASQRTVLVECWDRDPHAGPVMSLRRFRIRHHDALGLAKKIKARLVAAKGERA